MESEGDSLVEGLAAGRLDAFAALYDLLGADLFRVARRLLGSVQDAEDAVQEVFVGLARARGSLRGVKNPRAYVFAALRRVALRLAATRRRRAGLTLSDADERAGPDARTADSEQTVRLGQAVRGLSAEQREIIALKVDGGLTFAEIGAVLDISPNTAASRYRYALEKLRVALEVRP